MRIKGLFRLAANLAFPALQARKGLGKRGYYPAGGGVNALNLPCEAIYVQPVIDRQFAKLWQSLVKRDVGEGKESYCLKLRVSRQILDYDLDSDTPSTPLEGADIPDAAKNVVCRDLSADDRAVLISEWEGGLELDKFINLASQLGQIDEKTKASVFEQLVGAQRLGYILGRVSRPDVIGLGQQHV